MESAAQIPFEHSNGKRGFPNLASTLIFSKWPLRRSPQVMGRSVMRHAGGVVHSRIAAAAVLVLACGSCVGTNDLSNDPEVPSSERVLLSRGPGVRRLEVDGEVVSGRRAVVPAGRHELTVRVEKNIPDQIVSERIRRVCRVVANFEVGQEYKVRAQIRKTPAGLDPQKVSYFGVAHSLVVELVIEPEDDAIFLFRCT